jgi:hypothetical protein
MGHQQSKHPVAYSAMGGGLTGEAVIHASEKLFLKFFHSRLRFDMELRKIGELRACDGCRRRKIEVN